MMPRVEVDVFPDDNFHFCNLRADFTTELATPARPPLCRWWLENTLPKWHRDDVRAVLAQAAAIWPKVANVRVEEARSSDQADLIISCVNLGGPLGVLADCELPGPRVQRMRFDTSEQWTFRIGLDVPSGLIDLYRVGGHEWGHFWGMGHAPSGSANLMAPVYSKSIWGPQSWEVEQMSGAYGPPLTTPPPSPPPAPGKPVRIVIEAFPDHVTINGQKYVPPTE